MTRAVLSLGSNLGDRYAHLSQAVTGLGDALLVVSGVYQTPPWGDPDQPPYLNAAALVADSVPAEEWLARAHALEQAAGLLVHRIRGVGCIEEDVGVDGDAQRASFSSCSRSSERQSVSLSSRSIFGKPIFLLPQRRGRGSWPR